jgi:hypothetical protein
VTRCAIGFKDWEPCFVFGGKPYKMVHDHFRVSPSSVRDEITGHPCPKPLGWGEWMAKKMAPKGGTILDPFMGSGTTGVAALRMGCNFIGIEIEPKYFDIACKRIEAAYRQPDLFIEPPKKAEQLGLM